MILGTTKGICTGTIRRRRGPTGRRVPSEVPQMGRDMDD